MLYRCCCSSLLISSTRRYSIRYLSTGTSSTTAHIHQQQTTNVGKIDKEALMKLRRKTGYSFLNCRKALLEFGPDRLVDAENWLRELAKKEGWAKATLVSNRRAAQGVVAVITENHIASMFELNCETDFVAKAQPFKALVETIAKSALAAARKHSIDMTEVDENTMMKLSADIDKLTTIDGTPIKEVLALAIGTFGENIKLSNVQLVITNKKNRLFSSTHPREGMAQVEMGRFAALIAMRRLDDDESTLFPSAKLGNQLCQHIIGMKPTTLGEPHELTTQLNDEQQKLKEPIATTTVDDELNAFDDSPVTSIADNEDALLRQQFMLNPVQTVHQYVDGHRAIIIDFVRLECCGVGGDDDG